MPMLARAARRVVSGDIEGNDRPLATAIVESRIAADLTMVKILKNKKYFCFVGCFHPSLDATTPLTRQSSRPLRHKLIAHSQPC